MPLLNTIIVLWSGAIVDIPDGWALCDGNNDLPDLRNKFIVGSGDTYAISDTGGAAAHNHPFTGDGHIHVIPAGTDLLAGPVYWYSPALSTAAGTTDNANNLPPYYALAFIGKI